MEKFIFGCGLLILMILDFRINTVLAELSATPSNTISSVGKSAYFDCATTIKIREIHWFHYPISATDGELVYGFGSFRGNYIGRFQMERNNLTGASNLVITSVMSSDAGIYECVDDAGNGNKSEAQLTVLDSEPKLTSNMTPGEVIIGENSCGLDPEVVQFSCSIKYRSNLQPVLEWIQVGQSDPLTKGVTSTTVDDTITTNLTLEGRSAKSGQTFTCEVKGSTINGFSSSSGVVNVFHAKNDFALVEKRVNESLNCEEENSPQKSSLCSYKWVLLDKNSEVVVSAEPTVTPGSPGLYRCQVDCTVKKKSCSINGMTVSVTGPPVTASAQDSSQAAGYSQGAIIALVVFLILLLVITLVFGIAFFLYCKRQKGKKHRMISLIESGREEKIQNLESQIKLLEDKNQELLFKDGVERPGMEMMLAKAQAQWAREKDVFLKRLEELKKGPVGIEYSAKPVLIRTIQTEASKAEDKSIKGIALLNNELYIVSQKESKVEVYDSTSLELRRTWKLEELTTPEDACACIKNRCLYISENKPQIKEILRVDPEGKVITKWQTGEEFGRLSVSSEATVVVVVHNNSKLMEFSCDGNHIRTYDMTLQHMQHPMHAVKLKTGNFLIVHGYLQDPKHRLCELDVGSNKIAKVFGGDKGGGNSQLSNPSCMAVDREGSIMVADATNGRVLLLGSNFEFRREIISKENKITIPTRILLDELNGRLYVVDYKSKSRALYAFGIV